MRFLGKPLSLGLQVQRYKLFRISPNSCPITPIIPSVPMLHVIPYNPRIFQFFWLFLGNLVFSEKICIFELETFKKKVTFQNTDIFINKEQHK